MRKYAYECARGRPMHEQNKRELKLMYVRKFRVHIQSIIIRVQKYIRGNHSVSLSSFP